jgi:hypothetical protein
MAKKSAPESELPNPVIPPDPPVHKTPAPKKTERQLRVKFTDTELVEKGRQVGEKYAERARIESEFDAVKAQFKDKLARCDAEIGEVAGHLHTGWEYRKVNCDVTFDDPDRGKKTTRRLDTFETVEVEVMSMSELQQELPLTPAAQTGVDAEGNVRVASDEGGEGGAKAEAET